MQGFGKGEKVMVRKTTSEVREKMRGGNGQVEFEHVLSKEELNGVGRLYAKIRLKPGCSIGRHQHVGETEPFYVLEGHGTFVEDDGTRVEVGPGDVCIIEPGQSHSMENNTDEDLVFMALIYNA